MLSTPDLCAADKDQIRLALDPLIGVEVHLVVTLDSFSQQLYGGWLAELRAGRTTGWDKYVGRVLDHAVEGVREHRQGEQFWAGHELASILARWGWTFHADRLHVVADPDGDRPLARVRRAGRSVVRGRPAVRRTSLCGPGRRRRAPQGEPPARGADPALLGRPAARRGPRPGGHAGRSDHARCGRWWSAGRRRSPRPGTTCAATSACSTRRGCRAGRSPVPRDQLGVAVDALADALAENTRLRAAVAELETERDRLDRKRRKWKHRRAGGGGRAELSA